MSRHNEAIEAAVGALTADGDVTFEAQPLAMAVVRAYLEALEMADHDEAYLAKQLDLSADQAEYLWPVVQGRLLAEFKEEA